MSYCRFGWDGSDVYVFESANGLACCGCRLHDDGFLCAEPEEMIAHLVAHRRAGQFVPEHAIVGLWLDIPGAQRPRRVNRSFTLWSLMGEVTMREHQMLIEYEKLSDEEKADHKLPRGLRRRFLEHRRTLDRFERERVARVAVMKKKAKPRKRSHHARAQEGKT